MHAIPNFTGGNEYLIKSVRGGRGTLYLAGVTLVRRRLAPEATKGKCTPRLSLTLLAKLDKVHLWGTEVYTIHGDLHEAGHHAAASCIT
ncbi:hypothetical protein AVEN_62347-1 [Araneus ventricosus]|uniref:Uncharacterized protein n=1 Tax=Araneus ventricosus TaxID=182803 RepID=A0A4Y2KAH9_ARAVE|nr:hypothetical protein AVEN_62347-1 [Araneus ventricosus]